MLCSRPCLLRTKTSQRGHSLRAGCSCRLPCVRVVVVCGCSQAASRTHWPSLWAFTRVARRLVAGRCLPRCSRTPASRSGRSRNAGALSVPLQVRVRQVTPSTLAWGTVASMNFWRSSSLLMRLMPQRACPGHCARAVGIRRSEHQFQALPPPGGSPHPDHGLWARYSLHHHQQGFVALALVEGLLPADADRRRAGPQEQRHSGDLVR